MLALGISAIFAGLATHALLSAVGAGLALAGIVDWFKQVFPHPAHESVAADCEAIPVRTSRRGVAHVSVDAGLVRANLPLEFHPVSAGVRGGLAGGAGMALFALLYGIVSGHGVWYPINLLAAGFFPSLSLVELSSFDAVTFGLAVVIHALASALVGVLYGAMLPMLPRRPMLLGGVIAPLVWMGFLHTSLSLINPVLAAHVDWAWFAASQLAYGVLAGWVVSRRERIASAQPLPWQLRAGVEASGLLPESPSEGQKHV
ncbi:MAG TPA: hypothetical protein VK745_31350 [Polyangiaceae bacterium]|nr:hypothetical protein [Polyangiaceae bacterium]